MVKCALASGDSLVKSDQYGTAYTFDGGLGVAPGWKTGACDQNCQELISACLMAHVNTYGVHYPIWLDSAAPSVGWGLPPSNYKMEGTFFGNIMSTGNMNHGSDVAPLGHYCEADDVLYGRVAGRIGDINDQGAAPYYNAYLGRTCSTGNKCVAHAGGDGFTSCTDSSGTAFSNLLTVWRDPNAPLTPDSTYTYSLRSMGGAAGLALGQMGQLTNGAPVMSSTFVPGDGIRSQGQRSREWQLQLAFRRQPHEVRRQPDGPDGQ